MAIQDLTASLDLKQNLNIYATCKQGDNLNLILSIYDNSVQADLTNYNVRLVAMKTDNIPLIQEHIGITPIGNVVTIVADEQLTTTSGKTLIELQFINKTTGQRKATFNLALMVNPSTLEVNATISTATYTLLQELENKLDQATDFLENVDEAIVANNNLVNNISIANPLNTDLESNITTGTPLNSSLESNISLGNALKPELDTKNAQAIANIEAMEGFGDVTQLTQTVSNHTTQLSDIMKDFVTVTQFGAKDISEGINYNPSDSSTYFDSTDAFLQAVATGKPILIPYVANHFKITATLNLTNSIRFEGLLKMYGATGDNTHMIIRVNDYQKDIPLYIINPLINGLWDGTSATLEYDHAIGIYGSKNVVVDGGFLRNLSGDGVCISSSFAPSTAYRYSENIIVKNLKIEQTYRNLISIISVDGCTIDNINAKKYNSYVAGIDIEPNNDSTLKTKNIVIKNCDITSDNTYCINLIPFNSIEDVKIQNCKLRSASSFGIRQGNGSNSITNVDIIDCDFFIVNNKLILLSIEGELNIDNCWFAPINIPSFARNITVSGKNVNIKRLKAVDNSIIDSGNFEVTATDTITISDCEIGTFAYSSGYIGSFKLLSPIIRLIGNIFKQFKVAVYIGLNCNDLQVIANTFIPESTVATKTAISIGTDIVVNNLILENNIYNDVSTRVKLSTGSIVPSTSAEAIGIKVYYGTAIPTAGTYNKNVRLINTNPTVGSPKSWICTVSGTPGTWVSEGNL